MDKRDTTLHVVLTANAAGYVKHRAQKQGRSVSTYLARLVADDMDANGDPERDYSQSKELATSDKRTTVRTMFNATEPRKPAFPAPVRVLRRTAA